MLHLVIFSYKDTGNTKESKMEKTQTRRKRIEGIVKAAEQLGVTRVHLYLVLTGQRESRSLLSRYHALKQQPTGERA